MNIFFRICVAVFLGTAVFSVVPVCAQKIEMKTTGEDFSGLSLADLAAQRDEVATQLNEIDIKMKEFKELEASAGLDSEQEKEFDSLKKRFSKLSHQHTALSVEINSRQLQAQTKREQDMQRQAAQRRSLEQQQRNLMEQQQRIISQSRPRRY